MRVFQRIAYLLLLICGVIFPMTLTAQDDGAGGRGPQAGVPQTAQQRSGEAYFQQNCTLCHVYSAQKRSLGIQARTELIGLFKGPSMTETVLRQLLQQGIPGKMPGFRYNFAPSQIDDLIAYLKIR